MRPTADAPTHGPNLPPSVVRILVGLDVGLLAGLPAVAWLLFHSLLRGEMWWAKLNVAGALFYGGSVYTMGLSRASLAGCALLVAGYGLLGAAFGLIARPRGIARNLLLGLLLALTWQILCQQYLLKLLDPFAPTYFPPLSTLPAQLIFGIGLGRFGPRFRTLAVILGGTPTRAQAISSNPPSAPDTQIPAPPQSIDSPAADARDPSGPQLGTPDRAQSASSPQSPAPDTQIPAPPQAIQSPAADARDASGPQLGTPDRAESASSPQSPAPDTQIPAHPQSIDSSAAGARDASGPPLGTPDRTQPMSLPNPPAPHRQLAGGPEAAISEADSERNASSADSDALDSKRSRETDC